MSDLFWLTKRQMRRIKPYFPLSHGVPRVDDRRIISGIIFVIRNGLRWRDAPAAYGPHKTIYNRFIRWSRLGVFNRIFAGLAAEGVLTCTWGSEVRVRRVAELGKRRGPADEARELYEDLSPGL